jgi:hypothetical protein
MFKFLRKTALWILLAPAAIWGAGLASNQLVLNANHDTFPVKVNTFKAQAFRVEAEAQVTAENDQSDNENLVLPEGYIDETHIIMTDQTHLNFLADVFDMKTSTYSIGDFLLMFGEWLFTYTPFLWAFIVIRKLQEQKD